MSLQILPNWCKKLGVIIFIIFSFLEGRDDFIRGFHDSYNENKIYSLKENNVFSFEDYFGESLILFFGLLSLIGMLIYLLSKEKVEDDYINKLRLEAYQLSFLIVTSIVLVLYMFGLSPYIEMGTVISFLLGTYLIIFAIKKRTV